MLEDPDVTPAILAEQMGWSRFRAYRVMLGIERSYPGVVQRRGKQLFANASRIGPHVRGMKPSRLEQEVTLLRGEVKSLEERLDAEVGARIEFQRKAFEWFANGPVRASKKDAQAKTGT